MTTNVDGFDEDLVFDEDNDSVAFHQEMREARKSSRCFIQDAPRSWGLHGCTTTPTALVMTAVVKAA